MKSLFGLFLAIFLLSCNSKPDREDPESAPKQQALTKLVNSSAFNKSFEGLLNSYLNLKDNFVAEKDSGIAIAARAMIKAADSLQLNELKADTNLIQTARTYSEGISSELIGLLGERDLLAKRKSFQMVSDQLYDLIRTVQYNQIELYHAYCANAFDDQGAYWICKPKEMMNPYLPKTSSPCADVKDTIHFTPAP